MTKIFIIGMAALLTGCAGANIASQVRESDPIGGSARMLRCVDLNTGDMSDVNAQLQQYDSWKMVYVSEYTTGNKTDTAAVMCFEQDKLVQ
jgi:hypothetical protein